MKRDSHTRIIATVFLAVFPAVTLAATPPSPVAGAAPPVGPPTPLVQDTLDAITRTCLPLLHGSATPATAASTGFRQQDGIWTKSAEGRPKLELDPPDVANPHECTVTVTYAPGGGAALRAALGAWAGAQSPPLAPVETNQAVAGSPNGLFTSTWSGQASGGVENIVLSQEKPAAGAKGLSQSMVLVSLAPA
jgi:hypothetical protein